MIYPDGAACTQDRHPASFKSGGEKKSDLALTRFHAIAKQTIGGLAQGLSIEKPVVFEGGPLTAGRWCACLLNVWTFGRRKF